MSSKTQNTEEEGAVIRIRLKHNLLIEEKHGLTKGMVFQVITEEERYGRGTGGYWIMGKCGEKVLVRIHEADVL